MHWHNISIADTITKLNTDMDGGLSFEEAVIRQEKYGKNVLLEKKGRTLIQKFLEQFKDFMVLILLIAAVISLFVSEHGFGINPEGAVDAAIISAIIILNAVLGVLQESRAEKALEALKKMAAPGAKVIRSGQRINLAASELVVGDIIVIEAGDFIPADARLIQAANLKVEESSLTGESVPVEKHSEIIDKEDMPIGDMKNMVFATGIVTYGRGVAVVVDTGMNTQVGKIADLLSKDTDDTTPLQKRLEKLGKILGVSALLICAVIFVLELFSGGKFVFETKRIVDSFMVAVSLAVAAIPEGLPAVVTIVLAVGVSHMAKNNAIVRRLPAVETLGSASVICSDKTGTLTQNRMTVVKTYTKGSILDVADTLTMEQSRLLTYATLCNDGKVSMTDGIQKHFGDPTETALVAAALNAGIHKAEVESKYPRVMELPFDSERKMMTTVHQSDEGLYLAITKGAPDVLLQRCVGFENYDSAIGANSEMATQALRVLGVAIRYYDQMPDFSDEEQREVALEFVGLIGMIDPPRVEVMEAVKTCERAGIRPIMITGDHYDTACAIAKQLGILKENGKAITGEALSKMSDDELFEHIREYSVYARVAPEHKVRIVNAWQRAGEIVAMTGDGVNDAPALKTADIGCAMGITGTDVAKGAAHMILTDDNFATIVVAVKQGRGIYSNIKKAIQFLLSSNIGEILTIFVATLLGWATPLLPIHLLWVNLVTDSLPALSLGMEPVDDAIMNEKPRNKNESVFAHGMGLTTCLQGAMIGSLALIAFALGRFYLGNGLSNPEQIKLGQTMAFTVLAVSQLFHAFNIKSKRSLFKTGIFSNMYLIGAFIIGLILQFAVLEIPVLRTIFKLSTLNINQWGIVILLSFAPIIIVEIIKLILALTRKGKTD